jgi:hypothetical protein
MAYSSALRNQPPSMVFTVSARSKHPEVPIFRFLRRNFGNIPLACVGSVFGFVEHSTLYGGRQFNDRELSVRDVAQLNNAGIGIRIPLSNHFATREEYEQCKDLLENHHHESNSVIVTNDDLAKWIRTDFPKYRIDASVIKNINTLKKLKNALKLYDEVVLPMTANEDWPFLKSIEDKHRITLFANAGCAFTCPSKICYVAVSKLNKGNREQPVGCSQSTKERDQLGMVDFELQPLMELGFRSFKVLRPAPGMMTGF